MMVFFFFTDRFSPKLEPLGFLNTLNCGFKAGPCYSKPRQLKLSNLQVSVLVDSLIFLLGTEKVFMDNTLQGVTKSLFDS